MAEQKPGKPCYDNSRMAMYIMYTYIYIHIDTIVYIYIQTARYVFIRYDVIDYMIHKYNLLVNTLYNKWLLRHLSQHILRRPWEVHGLSWENWER